MVNAIVLGGIFNGHHIFCIFNHTKDPAVPFMTGTDRAALSISDIVTGSTKLYPGSKLVQRPGQSEGIFFFIFDKVENQSQSRFFTDPGELGNLVDSIFN